MNKKNVVSIEDRIPTLKQKRKKKANRRLILYLSLFFILIALIVYLQSPLSHVKSIHTSGNSFLQDDDVIEASGIREGTNIWTVDKEDAVKKLQKNPVIQEATISRDLPWTIDIHIDEADLAGYIEKEDQYYPLLGNGKLIDDIDQKAVGGEAPLLIGFSEDEYLQQMARELTELPKTILELISEIHWQPTDDNPYKINLYMNDGHIVDSTIRHFAENMRVYPSIVQELESKSEGIIHIGAGVYFESFQSEDEETSDEDSDSDSDEENPPRDEN